MHIRTVRILTLLACVGAVALSSCGSDSGPAGPVVSDPVYIWAGTGMAGYGATGQTPRKTQLYWPQDVVIAPGGAPVVIDWNNHRVIELDGNDHFKLVVGVADGDFGDPCPPAPDPCQNILATDAKLNHPTHVAFDANDDMVLCAWHNSELFLLDTTTGLMSRFCGTGVRPCFGPVSNDPQEAISACVDLPASVAFDPQGRLCFTDQANMIIRMVDETLDTVRTIAGTQPVWDGMKFNIQFGFSGDDGPATSAKLSFERGQIADPSGKICFDTAGNMYIADTKNHAVRVVDPAGFIHRFAGMPPVADAGQPGYAGDGGPATSAKLNEPRDVAADAAGNVYIADTGNNVVRMVKTDGTIITVVGVVRPKKPQPLSPEQVLAEDGMSARDVHLTSPAGVEVDANGQLWISDTENNVIRIFRR